MKRSLIITADDFGLSHGNTDTILEAVDAGVVTRVSVLANGEALAYALEEYAKRAGRLSIAVHCNLTEGPALSPASEIPLLVDGRGCFRYSVGGLWRAYLVSRASVRRAMRAQIRQEVAAQIAHVRTILASHNLVASALDGHQHVHMLPFVFDEIVLLDISSVRIPSEPFYIARNHSMAHLSMHGVARVVLQILAHGARRNARDHGIKCNDYTLGVLFSGRMSYAVIEAGLKRIAGLRSGTTEIIVHPGSARDGELSSWRHSRAEIGWHYSREREQERLMLMSQDIRALVAQFLAGTLAAEHALPLPVRFIIAGGTSAATALGLLYAFTEWVHLWYIVSATLAFSASIAVSFILQKYWTFTDRAPLSARQLVPFFILNISNVGLNSLCLYLVVEYLHVWYMAAEVGVAAVIAVWSFIVMRFVVFAPRAVR